MIFTLELRDVISDNPVSEYRHYLDDYLLLIYPLQMLVVDVLVVFSYTVTVSSC